MRVVLAKHFFIAGALIWMLPAQGAEPPPGWHQDLPSGPVTIDGVTVSGHIDSVSVADIVQAITAFKDNGPADLAELNIISKDEMHGYVKNRDVGWATVERTVFNWPDKSKHPGWDAYGQGIPEFPQALDCIRAAQQVYVFPVTTPRSPHRDDKHLRLLEGPARSELVDLLGSKENWYVGFNDLMYPDKEPTNVGFVFRNGNDELVLFFEHSDVVVGTFDGEQLSGTLDDLLTPKLGQVWEEWKDKYAQPELKARE